MFKLDCSNILVIFTVIQVLEFLMVTFFLQLHRGFMVMAFLCCAASFVIIFVHVGGYADDVSQIVIYEMFKVDVNKIKRWDP